MNPPVIDHLAYLRDRPYRRATIAALRRHAARHDPPGQLQAEHERDDACCRIEDWVVTLARIMQALTDDGMPSFCLVLWGEEEESAMTFSEMLLAIHRARDAERRTGT